MDFTLTEPKHKEVNKRYIRLNAELTSEDLEITNVVGSGKIAKSSGIDYMVSVISITVKIKNAPIQPEHSIEKIFINSDRYFYSYGNRFTEEVNKAVANEGYTFYFFQREPLRKSKTNCLSCNKKLKTSPINVLDDYIEETKKQYTKEKLLPMVNKRFLLLVRQNNGDYIEEHLSYFVEELSGSGVESLQNEMKDFGVSGVTVRVWGATNTHHSYS